VTCSEVVQNQNCFYNEGVAFEWSVLGGTELTRGDVISEARRQYTVKFCPALSLFFTCFDREWKENGRLEKLS
jgi:hypothetical protein